MKLKEVIALTNRMQADGVIERYGIGGAVGATFYLEPVATLGIDIFVTFRTPPGQTILSLQPIYDYLTARGAKAEGEHIVIADWPVQFLPPSGPLVEEALAESFQTDVDGEPTWVCAAEHLAAIALQTGRAKDKARLLQFIESGVMDDRRFHAILARHGLEQGWREFKERFLGDKQ